MAKPRANIRKITEVTGLSTATVAMFFPKSGSAAIFSGRLVQYAGFNAFSAGILCAREVLAKREIDRCGVTRR